jgi:TPP-dependent indolepyruvate ferredoxin oxidoreductase alpha subunit
MRLLRKPEEMAIILDKNECEGCGTCVTVCTRSAIILKETDGVIIAEIDSAFCDGCGECIEYCARKVIKKI